MRVTAALVQRTRYSEPVVEFALDRLFGGLGADALRTTVINECARLDAFETFASTAGEPARRAAPVGSVAVVASSTTIGVALVPALFALCAGCDVVVRERADDLTGSFALTLADEDPALAARLTTTLAQGHAEPHWLAALRAADAVVAFGGDAALRAIRGELRADARFIAYGHRTSAAYVARETLADPFDARVCADGLARDALLYDGEGCLSAHVAFVERNSSVAPEQFVALLRDAFVRTAVEFPVGTRDVASALAGAHESARFRAALGDGLAQRGDSGRFLLTLDPPNLEGPPLIPRSLAVVTVDGPSDAIEYVRRHALPLEALAVAEGLTRDDIVEGALTLGAARIARIGNLQAPSFAAPHGGLGRIAPFVRWIGRDP